MNLWKHLIAFIFIVALPSDTVVLRVEGAVCKLNVHLTSFYRFASNKDFGCLVFVLHNLHFVVSFIVRFIQFLLALQNIKSIRVGEAVLLYLVSFLGVAEK